MKVHDAAKKASANGALSWDQSQSVTNADELLCLPIDEFFVRLNTSQSGLTSQEAKNRLKTYGYNEIAERKRRTGVVEFLFHLRNPLVSILLLAGVISGFLGDVTSAAIIFSIVLLSVVLDVSARAGWSLN